jgi:hypothetical protein
MRKIRVSSVLPVSYRDELERIVFFNQEQQIVTAALLDSVNRYGIPMIVEENGCLRFRVNAFGILQSLYAFDDTTEPAQLVGVAMFVRDAPASIVVLHLAVHEDYTSRGKWSEASVVIRLVDAIRNASLRTHGIETLKIFYPHEVTLRLHAESRGGGVARSRLSAGLLPHGRLRRLVAPARGTVHPRARRDSAR